MIKPGLRMRFNIEDYYTGRNGGDILLAYKGSITTELINNVLETIESKLLDFNEASKVRKKVYNVLVESLQNLYHHIEELPNNMQETYGPHFGILVVSKMETQYKISTGNFIDKDKVSFLQEKIDKINSLSKDELKEMYKYILNHQKISEKGGGGLGLVDIARKTGNKLDYVFDKVDDDYYFYNLDVYVDE